MLSNNVKKSRRNSEPLWRLCSRRNKEWGLRNIEHNMNMVLDTKKFILGGQQANHLKSCGHCAFAQNFHTMKLGEITVFHVVHGSIFGSLWHFVTICDSYFITKCDKSLFQNASGFLLQNATVLLQNAAVITKCDVYYKMRWYNK